MSNPRASHQGTLLSRAQLDLPNPTAKQLLPQPQLAIINWGHPKPFQFSKVHFRAPRSTLSSPRGERSTHLAELAQRGQLGQRRQLHVGHAEELELLEGVIEPFDLPVAGPAVIEHQLRHLQAGSEACEGVRASQQPPAPPEPTLHWAGAAGLGLL